MTRSKIGLHSLGLFFLIASVGCGIRPKPSSARTNTPGNEGSNSQEGYYEGRIDFQGPEIESTAVSLVNGRETLALTTQKFFGLKGRLECSDFNMEISSSKFTIPAKSHGCVVRLTEFTLSNGLTYATDQEFDNLQRGGKAVFRAGASSKTLEVLVQLQLPERIIDDNVSVRFLAYDVIDGGVIVVGKEFQGQVIGRADLASSLVPVSVTAVAGSKVRISLLCAGAELVGATLKDVTCKGEKLSDHVLAFGTAPTPINSDSLKVSVSTSGKPLLQFGATFGTTTVSGQPRRGVSIIIPIDANDVSDRILVLTLKGQAWFRYKVVKMGPSTTPTTPPTPVPTPMPTATPAPQQPTTYSANVQPLVVQYCGSCHVSGSSPTRLENYAAVKLMANRIEVTLTQQSMPLISSTITATQRAAFIQTMQKWIAGGFQ